MARRSVESRTIDKLRRGCGLRCLNRLGDAGTESLFDHPCRCAGPRDPGNCTLVDADHVILRILREAVVVIVIQYRGECTCAVVDGLNSRAEFAVRACHPAVITIVDERRKLTHVAKADRLNGCQLSRQLLSRFRGLSQFFGDNRLRGIITPWTIGKNVSSGCIRMRNADVIDLYERVKVGTKVVVM